jgi:hypothetical protein
VDSAGTVGVTYYDFTNDDPSGGPLDTDAWFTASQNGGLTFTPRERLTDAPFDMRAAPDARGFFVGDYEGLTWADGPFVPVFVLANAGDTANPTDVFSRTASPDTAPARAAGRAERARVRTAQRKLEGAVRMP